MFHIGINVIVLYTNADYMLQWYGSREAKKKQVERHKIFLKYDMNKISL